MGQWGTQVKGPGAGIGVGPSARGAGLAGAGRTGKGGLTLLCPATNAGPSQGRVEADSSFHSVPCPWVITACPGLYLHSSRLLGVSKPPWNYHVPNQALPLFPPSCPISISDFLSSWAPSGRGTLSWPGQGPKGHLSTSLPITALVPFLPKLCHFFLFSWAFFHISPSWLPQPQPLLPPSLACPLQESYLSPSSSCSLSSL